MAYLFKKRFLQFSIVKIWSVLENKALSNFFTRNILN